MRLFTASASAAVALVLSLTAAGCADRPGRPSARYDPAVAQRLSDAFGKTQGLENVKTEVSGGAIVLTGEVPDSRANLKAVELALRTAPDHDIDNRLRLARAEHFNRDQVRDDIRAAWKAADLQIENGSITSHYDDSISLHGNAPDEFTRQRAEHIAKAVGAKEIKNKIAVK